MLVFIHLTVQKEEKAAAEKRLHKELGPQRSFDMGPNLFNDDDSNDSPWGTIFFSVLDRGQYHRMHEDIISLLFVNRPNLTLILPVCLRGWARCLKVLLLGMMMMEETTPPFGK